MQPSLYGPRSTIAHVTRSPSTRARADRAMRAACREAMRNGGNSNLRHWCRALKRGA